MAIDIRAITPGAIRTQAPPLITILAGVVTAAMLLPLVYLAMRAIEGGAFLETVTDRSTIRTLVRTCLLAAAVGVGTLAISLPAAWLTTATDLPLRRAWAVLLSLPLVFPSYVGALAIIGALGPRGMLQDILGPLGVGTMDQLYGFEGAWLVLTLFTFPYLLIPLRAAIAGLDRTTEEAARSLGASSADVFLRVTLPQLRPAIAAGLLLVMLYVLSDFGAVSLMRFDSLTRVIFIEYKSSLDRSAAASLALLLVAVAMAIIWFEAATRGRARYNSMGAARKNRVTSLGHWKWPAVGFCASIVTVSLILPTSVLVYWIARGVDAGQSVSFIGDAAVNSVQAAAFGALACLAAAMPIALLSVRYPGLMARTIEKISYSGYALPGISIALALVFFAANYVPVLYQTLPLLVFAYVVRFLPQALGACRTSLLQTNPKTEEAARGLGAGRPRVFGRVTLPQVLPGLSAGGLLVFLTVMKELPATLLLSPIGFDTLATQIWSATNEGLFAQAAVPAILLVLISAVPTTIMVWREQRIT